MTNTADCDVGCNFLVCFFVWRYCLFKDLVYSMGRKPGMPFPHLEPTRPYWWQGSKLFSQGDRTERLGLGSVSTLIRLFCLKEVEGMNGYEDFPVMCFWMRNKWFTFLNLISQTAEFPLHIDLGYFVMQIVSSPWWLAWNAKRLRKECVIRKSVKTAAT